MNEADICRKLVPVKIRSVKANNRRKAYGSRSRLPDSKCSQPRMISSPRCSSTRSWGLRDLRTSYSPVARERSTTPLAKREIIRRLGTSPSQLYRLLDQTNYRKSVDQLLRLLKVLDCDVQLVVRAKSA